MLFVWKVAPNNRCYLYYIEFIQTFEMRKNHDKNIQFQQVYLGQIFLFLLHSTVHKFRYKRGSQGKKFCVN